MGRENGVWVEFNSTPFVFLTDAFTGEFLCFCDLVGGHLSRNDVSVRDRIIIWEVYDGWSGMGRWKSSGG